MSATDVCFRRVRVLGGRAKEQAIAEGFKDEDLVLKHMVGDGTTRAGMTLGAAR